MDARDLVKYRTDIGIDVCVVCNIAYGEVECTGYQLKWFYQPDILLRSPQCKLLLQQSEHISKFQYSSHVIGIGIIYKIAIAIP